MVGCQISFSLDRSRATHVSADDNDPNTPHVESSAIKNLIKSEIQLLISTYSQRQKLCPFASAKSIKFHRQHKLYPSILERISRI